MFLLKDITVIEDLSGVFVGELKEIVKKAGISRINERCLPIVIQHFVDQSFCCLKLFNQEIFVTAFFKYHWKFQSKFSLQLCKKLFNVCLFHS